MQHRPLTRENVQFKITYTKTLLNLSEKTSFENSTWVNIFKKINLPLEIY